jgi:hypothetical protein
MLEEARAAFLAYEKAERAAKVEFEALMATRTQQQRIALARAVATAVNNGVPKARVNQEALGVTTPNAWVRWADLAAAFTQQGVPMPSAQGVTPLPPMEHALPIRVPETIPSATDWPLPATLQAHEHAGVLSFIGDPRDRHLRVVWPAYPSTTPDAPATLEGDVTYDPSLPGRWRATRDPQNKPTTFGTETGAFTYEVEQRRGASPVRQALDSFVAAAELPPYEAPGLDVDEDEGF